MNAYSMWKSFILELGKEVCAHKQHMVFGLSMAVVLILFSLVSLSVVDPTSATYVIVVLNLGTLVLVSAVLLIAIFLCSRRGS